MSKSSKQRRSDDEFKPPSAKKSKPVKQEQEHTSVQRIRLLDLIKYNYLNAGEEVFVKEQEGIITDRGTIKVLSGSGYIEYSNPTSWTKQVTGRENGGWGQIRLKSSKQTLSSIKEQYQKNMSSLEYIEDPDTSKSIYSSDMTASPNPSQINEAAPSDLTLPLKVRFINDEDRVFKIIWVSQDFKEFHTEYQGTLYTNLADFVSKIFEDFQKPATQESPGITPVGSLRFDELMYELSPGKWVRLAGNLFPSELMAQQGNANAASSEFPLGLNSSSSSSLLQPLSQSSPLNFSSSSTSDNCNNNRSINNNNSNNNHCNNSTNSVDNHLNDSSSATPSTSSNHNNSNYVDYHNTSNMDDEDDDDVEDEDYNNNNNTSTNNNNNSSNSMDSRRRRLSKSRAGRHSVDGRKNSGSFLSHCYKCLVYVEDSIFPVRVNTFGPTSVREILYTIFTECSLKHTNNGTEADFLRDYSFEIEDHDFGGTKILFPKSVTSFPTKCKIYIKRKEHSEEPMASSLTFKQDATEGFTTDEKGNIMMMDQHKDSTNDQPQSMDVQKDDDQLG